MAANDIVKLTLNSTYHGSRLQVGYHFRFDDGVGTMANLMADFRDNALASLRAAVVEEQVFTHLVCEQVAAGVPPSTVGPFNQSEVLALAAATDGDLIGEGMIGQGAAVFNVRTGIKGRRYRGRAFYSGAPEASAALGLWSAAQKALWDAHATALQNRYLNGGPAIYTMGIWSPQDLLFKNKAGVVVPRVGNIFTPMTTVTASSGVKTMRRRALGVGR